MHGEGEPEGQPASTTGELDREVRRVPFALDVHGVEVTRVLRVSGPRLDRVAVEQCAAVERREQP